MINTETNFPQNIFTINHPTGTYVFRSEASDHLRRFVICRFYAAGNDCFHTKLWPLNSFEQIDERVKSFPGYRINQSNLHINPKCLSIFRTNLTEPTNAATTKNGGPRN
uniref:Uncharacterized protein n=1 Tax=Solanum lycopersicum TaxID=4081 RepID=K4CIJ4_SOLLC